MYIISEKQAKYYFQLNLMTRKKLNKERNNFDQQAIYSILDG